MASPMDRSRDPSKVFVRDDAYAWLPGEIVSPVVDAPQDGGAAKKKGPAVASVRITLPDDWKKFTHGPNHPSLKKGGTYEDATGCVVRKVKLGDYPGGELPLQNLDEEGKTLGKSDMADLPHLHEAAMLYNLRNRHKNAVPYTRVGDIVVAMNPYQWIDGLYSEKQRKLYAERLIWNAQEEDMSNRQEILEGYFERIGLDPHVYETSAHAYRGLAVDRVDQAILVSGESGAGKTETVKIVMTHLATVEGTRGGGSADVSQNDVVKKISESNPLFEAFGNAKTVRNDNSSRFGKFTKLHFEVEGAAKAKAGGRDVPECSLAGSTFDTYLMEKARVVSHAREERTFHIFYQLLAAPDDAKGAFWSGLSGTSADSFKYVGTPDLDVIGGVSDGEAWDETMAALEIFGFTSGDKMTTLMRAVCAVLQLGNLTFRPEGEGSKIADVGELEKVSEILGVDSETIRAALLQRQLVTGGEEITVPLSPRAAKDGCDALAKEIYAQIFQELVKNINEGTCPPSSQKRGRISILDMFGFECFDVNRFEQLCINYANERIQYKYATDTYLALKDEYEDEGIEIYDFSSVDNSDVLHLIESPTGLIGVLNDEGIRPKGSDSQFVYKVKAIHRESRRLVRDRLHRPWEFGIRHFAGEVRYDATNFLTSNQDQLPKDLLECASQSANELIGGSFKVLMSELAERKSKFKRRRAPPTITTKFKSQLNLLMKDIKDARTRYIRCIKPNGEKLPLVMDHDMTMRQLASAGLMTAITVSRESFPNNLLYKVVWDRFNCLLPRGADPGNVSIEEKAKFLLKELIKGKERVVGGHVIGPYACGKTKVFFRSGTLEILESERQDLYASKAVVIQRWFRSIAEERRRVLREKSSVRIQARWRSTVAKKEYEKKRTAVILVQCWVRYSFAGILLRRKRADRAATIIQSKWKSKGQTHRLIEMKKAADIINRAVRNRKNRESFDAALHDVVQEARWDMKRQQLQRKLREPWGHDKDELFKDSDKMIEHFSNRLRAERGKVSELKEENLRAKRRATVVSNQTQTTAAALAASKLEVTNLQQENDKLKNQVKECRAGTTNLRILMNSMQEAHNETKVKFQTDTSTKEEMCKKEKDELKKKIRFMKREHAAEVLRLRHEASKAEERYRAEISKMQDEIRKSEESHAAELSTMLDALGTAHEVDTGISMTSSLQNFATAAAAGTADARAANDDVSRMQKIIEVSTAATEKILKELNGVLCEECVARTGDQVHELETTIQKAKLEMFEASPDEGSP